MPIQPKAFVYTEVQLSVPFAQAPWRELNPVLRQQPGFISKTWLAGLQNDSVGGFYAFATVEDAKRFVQDYFPQEVKRLDATFTARVFVADPVEAASRELASPYFA